MRILYVVNKGSPVQYGAQDNCRPLEEHDNQGGSWRYVHLSASIMPLVRNLRKIVESGPRSMPAESGRVLVDLNAHCRMAAQKRHSKTNDIKREALRLYRSRSWPSMRQAAKHIAPQIQEYGLLRHGHRLSEDRVEQTVYEWIRAAVKDAGDY